MKQDKIQYPHPDRKINRFTLTCPMCGEGKNSKDQGGTDSCFHCEFCSYVECVFCDCQ